MNTLTVATTVFDIGSTIVKKYFTGPQKSSCAASYTSSGRLTNTCPEQEDIKRVDDQRQDISHDRIEQPCLRDDKEMNRDDCLCRNDQQA